MPLFLPTKAFCHSANNGMDYTISWQSITLSYCNKHNESAQFLANIIYDCALLCPSQGKAPQSKNQWRVMNTIQRSMGHTPRTLAATNFDIFSFGMVPFKASSRKVCKVARSARGSSRRVRVVLWKAIKAIWVWQNITLGHCHHQWKEIHEVWLWGEKCNCQDSQLQLQIETHCRGAKF